MLVFDFAREIRYRLFSPSPFIKGLALKIVVCLIKKCDLMTIILEGCHCILLMQIFCGLKLPPNILQKHQVT